MSIPRYTFTIDHAGNENSQRCIFCVYYEISMATGSPTIKARTADHFIESEFSFFGIDEEGLFISFKLHGSPFDAAHFEAFENGRCVQHKIKDLSETNCHECSGTAMFSGEGLDEPLLVVVEGVEEVMRHARILTGGQTD